MGDVQSLIALACLAAFAVGFLQGERQERNRWNYWTGTQATWESKGDRR
jgi:hypothetical protein